eukprot:366546-Chlamydomonas_euryale.AAC.28
MCARALILRSQHTHSVPLADHQVASSTIVPNKLRTNNIIRDVSKIGSELGRVLSAIGCLDQQAAFVSLTRSVSCKYFLPAPGWTGPRMPGPRLCCWLHCAIYAISAVLVTSPPHSVTTVHPHLDMCHPAAQPGL